MSSQVQADSGTAVEAGTGAGRVSSSWSERDELSAWVDATKRAVGGGCISALPSESEMGTTEA